MCLHSFPVTHVLSHGQQGRDELPTVSGALKPNGKHGPLSDSPSVPTPVKGTPMACEQRGCR